MYTNVCVCVYCIVCAKMWFHVPAFGVAKLSFAVDNAVKRFQELQLDLHALVGAQHVESFQVQVVVFGVFSNLVAEQSQLSYPSRGHHHGLIGVVHLHQGVILCRVQAGGQALLSDGHL